MTLEWKDNSLVSNMCKTFARNNLWKVQSLCFDFDDLMQEFYIVFHSCKEKYSNLSDEMFMGKFKLALANRVVNLSKIARRHVIEGYYFVDTGYDDVEALVDIKLRYENMPSKIKRYMKSFDEKSDKNYIRFTKDKNGRKEKILEYFLN